MDHVVFVSRSNKELDKLLSGDREMIVRGSLGKKVPYGKVHAGDTLFFATGNSSRNMVKAKATALEVTDTPKMTGEDTRSLLEEHQDSLLLSETEQEKWSGKKYLTLIAIEDVGPIVPFSIATRGNGEDDDWIVLDDIDSIIE